MGRTRAGAFLAIVAAVQGACATHYMDYPVPRAVTHAHVPTGTGGTLVTAPALPTGAGGAPVAAGAPQQASVFLLGSCEQIATAYTQRAVNRERSATALTIFGGVVAGAGVLATTIAGLAAPKDHREIGWDGMTATGAGFIFTGAVLAASGTATNLRTTAYTNATTAIRAAMDDYRSYLRGDPGLQDASNLTDSSHLARYQERLCALLTACYRRQVGTDPIGGTFVVRGDLPLTATERAAQAASQEYLTTTCYGGATINATPTPNATPTTPQIGPFNARDFLPTSQTLDDI